MHALFQGSSTVCDRTQNQILFKTSCRKCAQFAGRYGGITLEMRAPGRYSLIVPAGTTAMFQNKEYAQGEYQEL